MENNLIMDTASEKINNLAIWRIIPDLLLHMDKNGAFLGYNRPKNMELYLPPQEFLGKNIQDIFPKKIAADAMQKIAETINTGEITTYNYNIEIGGVYGYFEARFVKYTANEVLLIVRDVTAVTKLRQQIDIINKMDSLTGAFNRNFFDETIERLKDGKIDKPLGFMICDIDSLKIINDSMGHIAGDNIIKKTAGLLQKCLVKDDMLFRIGGDEFVIITGQDMKDLYKKVKEKIAKYNNGSKILYLSISLGWQVFSDGSKIKKVFDMADNNMYKEKLNNASTVREVIINNMLHILKRRNYIQNNMELFDYLVKKYCDKLALNEIIREKLKNIFMVCDIGTIRLTSNVTANTELINNERMQLYRHCEIGFRILNLSSRYSAIADCVLKHHENWDGSGYPLGIKGHQIPLECRVFCLINNFCDMLMEKVKINSLAYTDIAEKIKDNIGKIYDPELAKVFINIISHHEEKIIAIAREDA